VRSISRGNSAPRRSSVSRIFCAGHVGAGASSARPSDAPRASQLSISSRGKNAIGVRRSAVRLPGESRAQAISPASAAWSSHSDR
jgi:hypothetical protein